MPEISRFFGIVVRMYYDDHAPPHIHVEYQGQRAVFEFSGAMTQSAWLTNRRASSARMDTPPYRGIADQLGAGAK